MPLKPETRFCHRVHRHFPRSMYVEKMFNPYRGGTPDYWISGYAADAWVEYKWLPKKPVRGVKNPLTALQKQWLDRAHAHGRNVYVAVGCPDGVAVLAAGRWNEPLIQGSWFRHTELGLARFFIDTIDGIPTLSSPRSDGDNPCLSNHFHQSPSSGDDNRSEKAFDQSTPHAAGSDRKND